MGRLATIAVVLAVATVGAAAALDALRGHRPEPGRQADRERELRAAGPGELAAAGVRGMLLYTSGDDCRLRGLALPALRPAPAPAWETCAFALGPGLDVAPDGTVFGPRGLQAAAFEGAVELVDTVRGRGRRFEAARAPAFRPDGTFTLVRRARLETVQRCSGRDAVLSRPGRCAAVLASEDELTAAAHAVAPARPLRLALETVTWLDDVSFLTVADAGGGELLLRVSLAGGRIEADVWLRAERLSGATVSPGGTFVSVLTGDGTLAVFESHGRLRAVRGSRLRAVAWAPDERWIAVLGDDGLSFLRPDASSEPIGPIPLDARDLAWS